MSERKYSVVLAVQSWIPGDQEMEVLTKRITTIKISENEDEILKSYEAVKKFIEPYLKACK